MGAIVGYSLAIGKTIKLYIPGQVCMGNNHLRHKHLGLGVASAPLRVPLLMSFG